MARKRTDNKKWMSRSSRKKSRKKKNRLTKQCRIRKNNTKPSRSTKPSQQQRKKSNKQKDREVPTVNLEEHVTEEILDARIVHDFLTERYNISL